MDMKESLGPAAVFPLGEENEAYAQYFVGKSYLAPLTGADAGVGVSNVTFEPGCRNHWHVFARGHRRAGRRRVERGAGARLGRGLRRAGVGGDRGLLLRPRRPGPSVSRNGAEGEEASRYRSFLRLKNPFHRKRLLPVS